MAKYFIGSVGTAEAFKVGANGALELAFISKTLTDSGINISTTKDDLRAGTGAPIVASFYHDPSVELTLTDVMWKPEYVTAQLGADFTTNESSYQLDEILCSTAGSITVLKTPISLNLGCGNSAVTAVWFTEKGKDNWQLVTTGITGKTVSNAGLELNKTYCVRYLAIDESARAATITSNMIPQELYLIITAPLFAGDACSASNGRQAGTIQFEVPRFKLAGSQDFAMAMSANQTLSLSGSALASDDGCDINGSKLLRIIEVISGRPWYEGIVNLDVDESYNTVGDVPHVYGISKSGSVSLVDNANLTFSPALASGKWAATGLVTITATGHTALTCQITVVAA